MISIALLSHRFGNIGHSFMATGAEAVAEQAFGRDVRITHFEQHSPFDVHGKDHPLQRLNPSKAGRLTFLLAALKSTSVQRFLWRYTLPLDFDLAIACGGPSIVVGGSRSVPLRLMLHYMIGAFRYRDVPVIDAAVGSCFPEERVPAELGPEDAEFYRAAFLGCSVVTVRERVAARVRSQVGVEGPLLPCIAMASGRKFEAATDGGTRDNDRYILVNFQRRGANEDWGQGIDPEWWVTTARAAVADLKQRHRVLFVAHSADEERAAKELDPDTPCVFPKSVDEYAKIAMGAKAGFVSRLHAGIALAGVGVPSLVVGTDTRRGAADLMGLDTAYVKTLSAPSIVERVERLVANSRAEHDRLISLREATIAQYATLFQDTSRTR